MKCNGDSLSLPPLSLSLLFMHICAWQSADGRVTSDHCRVTVQWLFSKKFQIAWNVQKRCLTVGRRSRDLRPLSRDRSVTFLKKISNCLKRPKNVVWQSADGRVTSDHCRVTVQWLFFKKNSNCLKRPKNVVWQSADGRVTSDHCRVTIQWLFSKNFLNAWNVQKTVWQSSNGRVTSDHSRVTFSDFFQKFSELLETSKKRCLTVIQRSRDFRPLSRDRSVIFFKNFPNRLKRLKNVVWQSSNGRVTSDHCRVTFSDFFQNFSELLETSKNVVWQSSNGRVTSDHCRVTFSDFLQNFSELLETSKKRCLTVIQRSPDLRPLSRDLQWLFFNFSESLETSKNVVWKSSDGRVTSDHCRVTVQRLFSKIIRIAWNVEKTLFDSRPTVAWPLTTVAWPFSDFF